MNIYTKANRDILRFQIGKRIFHCKEFEARDGRLLITMSAGADSEGFTEYCKAYFEIHVNERVTVESMGVTKIFQAVNPMTIIGDQPRGNPFEVFFYFKYGFVMAREEEPNLFD